MDTRLAVPPVRSFGLLMDAVAPLPALPRRVRWLSALASATFSAVLLGSIVLGMTGMAGNPHADALACVGGALPG